VIVPIAARPLFTLAEGSRVSAFPRPQALVAGGDLVRPSSGRSWHDAVCGCCETSDAPDSEEVTVLNRALVVQAPSLEDVRKTAQLLIVDDHAVPFQTLFERDGYHIQRWPKIENVSQLTDNHFALILLDLHGVGLKESPTLQGFGVLQHIKQRNPTQLVVAYSAQPWNASFREFFAMADAVLDKTNDYLAFKEQVDSLLLRRYTPGFFISKVNETLGDQVVLAPKVVPKALRAIRTGDASGLRRYLGGHLQDQITVDRVLAIVSIAISLLK